MGMLIRMRCPSCRQAFEVPHDLAGRKIRCKKCEAKMRVPVPAMLNGVVEQEAPEAGAAADEGVGEAALLRYASDKVQWKWLLTGPLVLYGFFLVLGIGAVLAFKHLGGGQQGEVMQLLTDNRKILKFAIPGVAYFLGGWLIAWHSIGRTIIEPALACLVSLAGIFGMLKGYGIEGSVLQSVFANPNEVYVFLGIPFVAGLIGAFIGEKIQGH